MTDWSSLTRSSALTFGYVPDPLRTDIPLSKGAFSRALVLDAPIRHLHSMVAECRIRWNADAPLPSGVYWFQGLQTGDFLFVVTDGSDPGPTMETSIEELSDDNPLMAAWAWAEDFWIQADTVPHPRFEIEDLLLTHPGDHDVTVRDRKFLRGQWSYTVLIDRRPQDIVESRLAVRPAVDDPRAWVLLPPTTANRFSATLTRAKLRGHFSNTLYSFRATRTTFRPYQFKPVLKLLQTGKARLLIADEVGLGKTIEAGLIWTELEARQEASRVLIVCPSSLVDKWKAEMTNRFGFQLVELTSAELVLFRERVEQNRLEPRAAYICSLERLRSWDGLDSLRETPPEFDLIIVDEAHALRNADTRSYALGAELATWAANLVFLTATPINLGQRDLSNLLELLAPEDFGDLQDLQRRLEPNRILNSVASDLAQRNVNGRVLATKLRSLGNTPTGSAVTQRPNFAVLLELLAKDQLSHRDIAEARRHLAELNTLSSVITRTKKAEVDERKSKRAEDRQRIEWTAVESDFYAEYLEWCIDRATAMQSSPYFAMQMPLRLASACLQMARRSILPEVWSQSVEDGQTNSIVPPPASLVAAARRLGDSVDSKAARLDSVLTNLHRQRKQALLFTHSRPTLSYLFAKFGVPFRVAVLHGDIDTARRQETMRAFRAGAYDFVFANRVASEGLDFEFCSAVINYDLPWNPMEIEQRIGRIDRIGQQQESILVVNFVNEETIDERILSRLLDRIEIFESSIGALEPIIAEHAPKILQAGFDFRFTDLEREQKIHEALIALEEQQAGAQDIADASSALLVSNDVDVAGLENDLTRTGRYIGQLELARLLEDWALIDKASEIRFGPKQTLELRGNATMADKVDALATSRQRTRSEVAPVSTMLRQELPIVLNLDQEVARVDGGALLTANHPLVVAAADLPDHRQGRFASLSVNTPDKSLPEGTFLIVLAIAISASRGGDEIWGEAVSLKGKGVGEQPVDALLAALAEGRVSDALHPDVPNLQDLAERALNTLSLRHSDEQLRKDADFVALQDARGISLREQHRRRQIAIGTRIETARARNRDVRIVSLFESQQTRAEGHYARVMSDLSKEVQPEIRLEPLAVCLLTISHKEAAY